jgi:hypothetical protein
MDDEFNFAKPENDQYEWPKIRGSSFNFQMKMSKAGSKPNE